MSNIIAYKLLEALNKKPKEEKCELVRKCRRKRLDAGESQFSIAHKMHTQQSNISAIENHPELYSDLLICRYITAINE